MDNTSERVKKEFVNYVLEHNKFPVSVFSFMKKLKLSEDQFYNMSASFEALEAEIWQSYFDETIARLHNDSTFPQYAVREKLLALYFTFFETLKSNRSFVRFTFDNKPGYKPYPFALHKMKESFSKFVNELVTEGKESKEIAERKLLKIDYAKPMWGHLVFMLNFWIKDTSKGFEQTDVAIEKSVNLAMDLMGQSALDSAFDFAKFLFQSHSNKMA